nr:MAG TPA: hypothetical protein [Caudoviricetes sp.]
MLRKRWLRLVMMPQLNSSIKLRKLCWLMLNLMVKLLKRF